MDILTYVTIAACYGCGCMLSYRLGREHGTNYGIDISVRETVKSVAAISGKSELEILTMIQEYRKSRVLKS